MDFNAGFIPDQVKPEYLPTGESTILDFVNPFDNIVSDGLYSGKNNTAAVDPIAAAMSKFANKQSSNDASAAPTFFDWNKSGADRYTQSSYYKELGFDPGVENESKYGYRQTWGDTISNALAGGGKLAAQTFIEGWKGWGNIADALFSWDSSKLTGSDEELLALHQEQQQIMDKYAIFTTPESEEGIFNKQFFGNMLQQGGFALGAIAQFASEELLTLGLSTELSALKFGASIVRIGETIQRAERIKDLKRLGDGVWKSEKFINNILKGAKKMVPLVSTTEDLVKYNRAGAGALQLAYIGAGGIKRTLAEANMAFTEARMEAAGTYGDLYDKLKEEYITKNGQEAFGVDAEKMRNLSMQAAEENFGINSGILMLSNRLQFDNLISKFGTDRKILKELGQFGEKTFEVSGKIAGQETKRAYTKGMLGAASKYGEIAADFGTKTARWELAKSLGKGIFKWEASEGIQEILQDVSNKTLQDYYYDLYHGTEGYSRGKSLAKAAESVYSKEGMKTFLMGALTGRLLSPITYAGTKAVERYRIDKDVRAQNEQDKQEAVGLLNAFYADPKNFLKEEIANFKVQDAAAQDMSDAALAQDRYTYNNAKDSAFAKLVTAAKQTDMLESVLDTIRSYGEHIKPEEFKEAFGLDATDAKIEPKAYFNAIAAQVEDFSKTYEQLKDKYSDLIMPEIYKKDSPEYVNALISKKALDLAIEILATNKFKAQKVLVRAQEILNDVSQNPVIGNSSGTAFRVLGSATETDKQIELLNNELKAYRSNPTPDKALRKLIKLKQEELDIITNWKENWESLKDIVPGKKRSANKALKAYERYLNLKNREGNLSEIVANDDVKESYDGLIDFIELNKSHGEYIDAYNTLADPKNFKNFHQKAAEAIVDTQEKFQKEHTQEISEEDVDNLDLTGLDGGSGITAENNPFDKKDTKPDLNEALEKYLQEKYNNLKQGEYGDQLPAYEQWRATAATGFIKEFERKNGKVTPATTGANQDDLSGIDLENPENSDEETQADIEEFIGKAMSTAVIGGFTLKVGDVLDDEEIVAITEHVVSLEKSGLHSHEDIAKMLKAFNGKNLKSKEELDDTSTEKKLLENGSIENVNRTKQKTLNQDTDGQVRDKNKEIYGDSDKVINAGYKINNNSDLYTWTKDPVTDRKRTGPNPKYPMVMGTTAINTGTEIKLKADTNLESFEEYDYLELEKRKSRSAADYFDVDGKISPELIDEFPIAVYATVGGKQVKLGHLPTVKWVEARKQNGDTLNVLEFINEPDGSRTNNLVEQVNKLRELRTQLYNNHNKNNNFVLKAVVDNKSEGKLRVQQGLSKLKENLHPSTKLGIIRNGMITLNNGQTLNLAKDQLISNFDFAGKEGWPVVLLETPTGRTLVSYVSVPTLSTDHQDLIIEAWKAFHALNADPDINRTSAEYKTVQAIYKAYGNTLEDGEKVDFNVLRGYVNDYVTYLSGNKYDPIKEGSSQLNITEKGELTVWAVDTKDVNQDLVFTATPAEFSKKEDQFRAKLSRIHYNVKLSSETAVGINSTEKKTFLSYNKGKLTQSSPQTYNEYMMGILETNIEKGTPVDPKDKNSKYVYFANPVITFAQIEESEVTTINESEQPAPAASTTVSATNQGTTLSEGAAVAGPVGSGQTNSERESQVAEIEARRAEKIRKLKNGARDVAVPGKLWNSMMAKLNAEFDAEIAALNPVAAPANPFLQAQKEDDLDLTKSFGATVFDAGLLDGEDLSELKSIRTIINQLNLNKECK